MIKRRESNSECSRRTRSQRSSKKRRLSMEGLERRELLAAEVFLPAVEMPDFTTGPRNVGTVQSLQIIESENVGELGENDNLFTADVIPLGTGPGQQDTIDISGTLPIVAFPNDFFRFRTDVDTYAVDLRAGDILDIAVLGAAGTIDVDYANGTRWFGTDLNQAGLYAAESPLQTLGNAIAAQVVPEDGRYYITVSPIDTSGNYTLGLRTYRPIVEQLPIGSQQVIFLDFDGGLYTRNTFTDFTGIPQPGVIRVPSLQESLPLLGIEQLDNAAFNRLVDLTLSEVERQFAFLGTNGNAGDYDTTGTPGDYGVMILNSRDHVDPGFHPLVTRVFVGGSNANAEQGGLFGISSTLDIGNFSMDDEVLALLDLILPTGVPMSPTVSDLDAAADLIALTISHELSHSFGTLHTERANNFVSIIDGGTDVAQDLGAGADGIYGTLDDVDVNFIDDIYAIAEGYVGTERVTNLLANTLVTGTSGVAITGRVFQDGNRDGSDNSVDPGLGGVRVFADFNGNGAFDPSEPSDLSSPSGNYTLNVRQGTFNIIAVTPDEFVATTPTTVSATGGATNVDFGFFQVVPNITGTVFADNNGNGIRDTNPDLGLEGIYVYIDLDGDDRPDLGEPGMNTEEDGTYVLNFPGPRVEPYTIRVVVPAGFEQTFPVNPDEHTVVFSGGSVGDNFDFGLLPSQDFGDAPDTYGTTTAADGARHGVLAGLTIGATVDRDTDGQPTAVADGDDTDLDGDDEDGVILTSPLGPGAPATFQVTATNTTGAPAFLQGFIDFDRDGTFTGPGEQFASDFLIPSGTVGGVFPVTVTVPAGTPTGDTFTRFRLSQSSGIGATGFADTGEVEDHTFPILAAAEIANPDEFSVSRNSQANNLPVLANDFETVGNQLTIVALNTDGTAGQVVRSLDNRSVFYTPPNGFIGRDVFSYSVVDAFGTVSTASVVVNVTFQSNVPIALDDSFEIPEGSVNRALNVLDNDVPSTFGGLTITSVSEGTQQGTMTIVGGGQSLRYTPRAGVVTEQFTYFVQDAVGSTSSATITINLLPGSQLDDVVDFTIGIFDAVNVNTPVTNVQVGDEVLVRVTVDDVRAVANPEGVASAFMDLLYTDTLVATTNTDLSDSFPFDISFGPLFSGAGSLITANADTPGLIDEVGGVQNLTNQQPHAGPVELFTVKMQAVSPGVATFRGDPADADGSETTVLTSDTALEVNQLRFSHLELDPQTQTFVSVVGPAELTILPSSDNFTAAVDDSFPDAAANSASPQLILDVLANDNLGPTGTIREFGLATAPGSAFGVVDIDNNNTPDNLNDDFIRFTPSPNANGLASFTYLIVTEDNIRSTAEVTIALGNVNANADVAIDFALVNSAGTPITSVGLGERFGVQVIVDDLRINPTFVFAGFVDMLYSSGTIQPSNTMTGDNFDFDVVFGPGYVSDPNVNSTAAKPGVIDELGTLFATAPSNPAGLNPGLLATVFFEAVGLGTASIVGDPADATPFSDTLLFQQDEPVDREDIRYDILNFSVTTGGGGGDAVVPLQNAALRQDVNADGLVSPIDALLIINEMSREDIEGELVIAGSRYYTDVNGDKSVSAIDALQVINYLNRASNIEILAEQVVADLPTSEESTDTTDEVFTSLQADAVEKIVSTNVGGSFQQTNAAGGAIADTAGDDDDDLLNLLADDISGLQS